MKYTRKRSQEMQPLLGSKSTYIVFLLEVNMYGSDAKIIFFLLMYDVNIYDNSCITLVHVGFKLMYLINNQTP